MRRFKAMARYHFATQNGVWADDPIGTELANVTAAKDVALRVLTESLHRNSDVFWKDETFKVLVSDDSGLMLFTVEVIASYSPSMRTTPRR